MCAAVQNIRVYKERRRGGLDAGAPGQRTYCWTIEGCDPAVRAACHAYIVNENCWDFWTVKGAKYRSCCHKLDDCRSCSIVQRKFSNELPVYVRPPLSALVPTPGAMTVICQNLHFLNGIIPQGRALRQFLREQVQSDHDAFRCRRRGVHLDPGYVAEICATRAAPECVFL